jgi:hypothetical protein
VALKLYTKFLTVNYLQVTSSKPLPVSKDILNSATSTIIEKLGKIPISFALSNNNLKKHFNITEKNIPATESHPRSMDVDDPCHDSNTKDMKISEDVVMKDIDFKTTTIKSEDSFFDQNNQNILNENVESRGSCGSDDSMWRPW